MYYFPVIRVESKCEKNIFPKSCQDIFLFVLNKEIFFNIYSILQIFLVWEELFKEKQKGF